MAEALVSIVLEKLSSIISQQVEEGISLIVGADEEIGKLRSNFLAIQAVLADAENKQVKDSAVRLWLDNLKDVSYDIDDVLDEWNTEIQKLQVKQAENASKPLKKVCSLIPNNVNCFRPSVLRYETAVKIRNLDRKLDIIAAEKDRFGFNLIKMGSEKQARQMTTSVIDLTEVHGRDEYKNTIVNLLLSQSNREPVIPIIAVIGMGGIGKTTLARLAFNDEKVKTHFDAKIWVCVSMPFDEIRIAKAILESLTNNAPNLVELETVMQNIHRHIEGKKFLVVLDDVWTEKPRNWDQLMHALKCGSPESRILMTTRKENVADVIGATTKIPLSILSEEECWSLFSKLAFSGRTTKESEELEEIGRKIVQKCEGLPLAVKTLGSLLRFKRKIEEWENVLKSETWEIKEVEEGLFLPLLLSYYDLGPMLKKCFLYCAIFPKDYNIGKDKLIKLWMSQDYLKAEQNKDVELVGEEYFETLAVRSFFQDFERSTDDDSIQSCKMHDVVNDFAKFLAKNECFTMEVDGTGEIENQEDSLKGVRHSMIKIRKEASFPSSFYAEKSVLRSLLVEWPYSEIVYSKLFDQLTCLRSLILSGCSINELPLEIEKLIHLRHLDLSYNMGLTELPETLCRLYNLQTLDVGFCQNLQKLPQGMGKLINLRYLINWNTALSYIPKSIERLIRLRTIMAFVVTDGSYGRKACSLECLKDFNHLRVIRIRGLGNVTDVGKVKRAEFHSKKNLRRLDVDFEGMMNEEHEVLLEALQTPPNVEMLCLQSYRGNIVLPNWMMSLFKLRVLSLRYCTKCESLPPLGRLSSLEFLFMYGMKSVKRVGNEFLGSNGSSSSSSVIVFSNLKSLWFEDMEEWEEWNYDIAEEEDITVMPLLQNLVLYNCPKLRSMPNHLAQMTLKKTINLCPLLERNSEN